MKKKPLGCGASIRARLTAGAVKQKNIIKAMEYNITARRKGQENECENYRQNREIYYL